MLFAIDKPVSKPRAPVLMPIPLLLKFMAYRPRPLRFLNIDPITFSVCLHRQHTRAQSILRATGPRAHFL